MKADASLTKQQQQQLIVVYRQAAAQGIPEPVVTKLVEKYAARARGSGQVEEQLDASQVDQVRSQVHPFQRLRAAAAPAFFLLIGLALVFTAVGPLVEYLLFTSPQLASAQLISPIPPHDQVLPQVTPDSEQIKTVQAEIDYTDLSNWFAAELPELNQGIPEQVDSYFIEIPALNIEKAEVRLGGTNLDKSLIQYPGTAEPGELGAPVIFGHSVLRRFYNPVLTNPRRYVSIFSTIMTLKPGDDIFVTHQGERLRYQVLEKTEVKPEDVYILQQRYDARLLKLVTCVPEGTYLRRGVVTAGLIE